MKFRAIPLFLALLLATGCARMDRDASPSPASGAPGNAASGQTASPGVIFTRIGAFSSDGEEIQQQGSAHKAVSPDENAVLCTGGGRISLSDVDIQKSGAATDPSACRYSGVNAAVAAAGGGFIALGNATVTTDGFCADGVSSVGAGSEIQLDNSFIVTSNASSAGLVAADGGSIAGASCNVTTDGGSSPAIFAAGGVSLRQAKLRATLSNSVSVSGAGSVSLSGCEIIGAAGIVYTPEDDAQSTGSLTLENCLFSAADNTPLSMSSGTFTLTLKTQQLTGDLSIGAGTLSLTLTGGSAYTGNIVADDFRCVSISLDSGSTWTLTGETNVGVLTSADESLSNIIGNGNTLYYDSSLEGNAWLASRSLPLAGGGFLVPRI